MKRTIPLLLALLLLAGCGVQPPAPAESADPARDTPAPAATPATDPIPDETEQPSAAAEPVLSETEIKLDGTDSYLRLKLPEGWTWTEGEESAERRSVILQAPTDDGFRIELAWWNFFGMCGTGVDFREVELPGGRKGTLATESGEDAVWWTLILSESPDWFTMQISAPQALIDAHRAEIDLMTANLQIGALSHLTVVAPPAADR